MSQHENIFEKFVYHDDLDYFEFGVMVNEHGSLTFSNGDFLDWSIEDTPEIIELLKEAYQAWEDYELRKQDL